MLAPATAPTGDPRAAGAARTRLPLAACAAAALLGCSVPMHSTQLSGGPEPVEVRMHPAHPSAGQRVQIVVQSPGADSIAFGSANGVDRYWSGGPVLKARLAPDFGDSVPVTRYAERWNGHLLSVLKKPARISTCRLGRCREFYHEIPVSLPERNGRSVVLTAGWSSVLARRSITGVNRAVVFKEVLNQSVWSVQGEWAAESWNARAEGFLGGHEYGGSVDLSRVLKRGDGLSYGVAMHVGVARSEWLPDGQGPALADRTAYRAAIGPSLMLKGVTVSSLFGLYADGAETLQLASTRISVNGDLTAVRNPITVTAEKTFAFGSGPIVARRWDAVDRVTAGVRLLDDLALNVGVSSRRIAWPGAQPTDDLRAAETLLTVGGQYSLTW